MAKILFICWSTPLPANSGGKVRVLETLQELSKKHQVHLICWTRNEEEEAALPQLKKICSVTTLQRRHTKSLKNFLLWFVTAEPLNFIVSGHDAQLTQAAANLLESKKFDLIIAEPFYSLQPYLGLLQRSKLPKILIEENIEWDIYFQYSKNATNPLMKLFWFIDAIKMRHQALQTYQLFDCLITVSSEDAAQINKLCPDLRTAICPNGVNYRYFHSFPKNPTKDPTISFLGNFRYLANQDAVKYLLSQIMPSVWARVPSAQLLLVGSNPPAWIQEISDSRVTVTGTVPDVREYLARSWVAVAPLRIASGTQLKVMEAAALGLPLVGSPKSLEGIDLTIGESVLVGHTGQEIANALVKLLKDAQLRDRLSDRATLESKKYAWERCLAPLMDLVQSGTL